VKLTPNSNQLSDYLQETEIIDFSNYEIQAVSEKLKSQSTDEIDLMKRIYAFVRDEISHSVDIGGCTVTLKASDVLKEKHGICFAKSHLLAALYRLNKIPTGFCYQKLILDDEAAPILIFHGLCGVYSDTVGENGGWVRLDPRGNKVGVDAQFSLNPNEEKIAFIARPEFGEEDFHMIYVNPAPEVIQALMECKTREDLWKNLPMEIYGKNSDE
jgi:transglutaminase-like putative cysteine protease